MNKLIIIAFLVMMVLWVLFVPEIKAQAVAWCNEKGLCLIYERDLDALNKLAQKAGKGCT